ncbi:MAG: DUF1343 domain-containing protein [Pseudomonadota bacterium]
MVKTGLDIFFEDKINNYKSAKVGLVVNPTSVNSKFEHAINLFHNSKALELTTLFGPQHGIRGETQDNMVEWEGFDDLATGLPVYSLYGKHRKPTKEMLKDCDVVVFDIQDIGAKFYTFIYTMSYVMQACAEFGKKFMVLDRPNPISADIVEGSLTYEDFTSFVGLHPILIRHGMTVGELAHHFNNEFHINCDLDVIKMQGYDRKMWFDETFLPWIIPSPNMPTLETATVYPGMCLIEGTNISEGRGTTRPFEFVGAPFIEPGKLLSLLNSFKLPGVFFRPVFFQPTFQKWYGKLCGGLQIHVTDRNSYKSVLTAVAIIKAIYELYPKQFKWKEPPYEYEYKKLPFDILAGSDKLRFMIEKGSDLKEIEEAWEVDKTNFIKIRQDYLIY